MPRATVLLLSLLVTTTAAAKTADLRVTLAVSPSPVRIGETMIAVATVENRGPNEAHDTRFTLGMLPNGICYAAAKLGTLKAGAKRTFTCSALIDHAAKDEVEALAIAQSFSTPEPSEAHRKDNSATVFTPVHRARLEIALQPYRPAAVPGVPMPLRISYRNTSRLDATNTVITLGSRSPWVKVPPFCTVDGNEATCPIGTLKPSDNAHSFEVAVLAFDQPEVSFLVTAQIDADEGAHAAHIGDFRTYRTAYVTRTGNDSSPGSLRSALFMAGTLCRFVPCLVAFRIPTPPGTISHTIRLDETPLDRVRGVNLEIDGTTQAMYFGDTNPNGPEIVIDGSALTAGDAFRIPSCDNITMRGLAVQRFPRNAFVVEGIDPCSQATRLEDNAIALNGQNGVAIDREAPHVKLHGNTFHANGALAIDRGLDGPDAGLPRIRSARYENGATVIELEPDFGDDTFVTIYASDAPDPSGFGEGQRILGEARSPDWRLIVPADLRGQWITATLTTPSSTSEFGPALETQ